MPPDLESKSLCWLRFAGQLPWLAFNMASEKPGYFLFLSLIIARCVRGQYGAPFVIKHTVTNWITFTRDFGAFCKGLVVAAESYSKEMGRTHLAHRDGLGAAFSGLQFLRTLKRKACRMRLSALANEFKSLFTRLLRQKVERA